MATLTCQSCGATLEVPAEAITTTCPYCASPSVVERPPVANVPRPRFVIPFIFGREHALGILRQWMQQKSGFFTHPGLRSASVDDVRGVYAPAYLYGAIAHSEYTASIGENYTETEYYTTTDDKGNTRQESRTVTRTEYRHLAGMHSSVVRDVLVTASRFLDNAWLEAVEPFDLRHLRRASAAAISGWPAELPTLDLAASAELARQEATTKVGQALPHFMPGDSAQNLQFRTRLDQEVVDLVLVPLWVFSVRYDAKKPLLRILVNGQTAKAAGVVPKSTLRIVLAIVIPIALLGILLAALLILAQVNS
ncbi:hypothetical protein BH09MYX1_BH09MYX1_50750 [soil metagenome]